MLNLALLILGFIILTASARWFVDGAIAIGKRYRLSELFIGVSIVAIGTSLPELAVNLTASARGFSELAAANIFGSNIANILLIIGAAALIRPIAADVKRIRIGLPLTILATLAVAVFAHNFFLTPSSRAVLGRIDGLMLIALFMAFAVFTYRSERLPAPSEPEILSSPLRASGAVIVGAAGLTISANIIVNAANGLASSFNMSQTFIGATVVALGTSLPELAAGVAAARRNAADLLIGNVVGSNIFNLLVILGLSALVAPIPFNGRATTLAVLAGVAAALLWGGLAIRHRLRGLLHPHYAIRRSDGMILIGLYALFLVIAALQG